MTDNVKTIENFPSSTKKNRSSCMKMLGHGFIASSNLFILDSYQDLVEIDSEFLMTGTIINIPRTDANYWTIHGKVNHQRKKSRVRVFGHK